MRCLLMAGLLTYPVFMAFPSRRQTSVVVTVAVDIKTLIHTNESDLQQRELLQIYTAFPFNQLVACCDVQQGEPLRAQK